MIKKEDWRPVDGLILEPNALRAARETTESLALTAGPGAGKTEMLAQRADFLLRTGVCRYPKRILAISFKVDASRNLKDRVRHRCGPELAARLDSHTFHAFAKRLIDRFRPVLSGRDTLDPDYTIGTMRIHRRQITFEDLVPLAVQILQDSEIVRNAVRQTYSHVFLDEFQDCNNEQYKLVRSAFLDTKILLTAVGDTKQRIMGWAGALEGIFERFANDFHALSLNLYQNFRSQLRLRRMQNAMVKVMDPEAAVPDSELLGHGGSVEILESNDNRTEAKGVSEIIYGWINTVGIAPSQIAVLVSRQPELYAQQLTRELVNRQIPFRTEQALQDLSVEPAARLIVDFLIVVLSNRAPDPFNRLMDFLLSAAIDDDDGYRLRTRWSRFIDDARTQLQVRLAGSPQIALEKITAKFLEVLGRNVLMGLSSDYERGGRLDEVIEQTHQRIRELLQVEADPVKVLSRFSEDSAVRVMTIHKSKGLEFEAVVMMAIEKETFWGKTEDERSAFFVGISRAKERLLLSVAKRRERPDGYNRRWDETRKSHTEFLSYAVQTA